jgi:hypothetical protein
VGRLEGGDDSLRAGEVAKGVDGLVVGHGRILDPPGLLEVRVFRADARIIEARGGRVRLEDLAPRVLKQVREGAMEDPRRPAR